MRAATWSPEFDLGETIAGIKASLEAKKFSELDNKTFLRALGAAAGNDFSAQSVDALRDLPKDKLSEAALATKDAAQRAADFLATQIGAPRAEALPYANQFAVLCEIFRLLPHPSDLQLTEIARWFWLTTLSGYFGGWDSGQMTNDTRTIRNFASGRVATLGVPAVVSKSSLWGVKPFRSNSAVSKMLGLMLAHGEPLDLLNGQKIDVDKSLAWSNDKEYHHFFPQGYLSRRAVPGSSSNVVGNIILLTSKSNIEIRDRAPSDYLSEIVTSSGRDQLVRRLESNLVPAEALNAALADNYREFLRLRSKHLQARAEQLAGQDIKETAEADEIEDSDVDPTD